MSSCERHHTPEIKILLYKHASFSAENTLLEIDCQPAAQSFEGQGGGNIPF
jgi:hypothetical protein